MKPGTIDIGDVSTWPRDILDKALALAPQFRGSTQHVGDLWGAVEYDAEFQRLLRGIQVRVFHATRLLDHEVEAIWNQGLRVLSEGLVHDRVEGAYRSKDIDDDERRTLHAARVFARGNLGGRPNQVCFFMPENVLDEDATIDNFTSTWGGEAFCMSPGVVDLDEDALRLGRPAIVVARVSLSSELHFVSPSIGKLFIGRVLGLRGFSADVHYRASVPPDQIEAIWQPGMVEYDRHLQLSKD